MLQVNMLVTRYFNRGALCCGLALALVGCSVPNPVTATPSAPVGAYLGGNWLLLGSMPAYFVSSTGTATNLALSVDVQGTRLVAGASLQATCASGIPFADNFQSVLVGTVAADGTFSLALPSGVVGQNLTISGKAPISAGGPWTGQVTYTSTSATPCIASLSNAFVATPVADVTGTYAGQGTSAGYNGSGGSQPGSVYSLTETLQQRVALPSSSTVSDIAVGGSIQTTGFPCFSKGTQSSTSPGLVQGNEVFNTFTMDDGSTLQTLGVVTNTASTQLAVSFIVVVGGNCQGDYIFNASPIVLSR